MGNFSTHRRGAILAASLLGFSLSLAMVSAAAKGDAARPDDGWRRTAAGWERTNHWQSAWVASFRPASLATSNSAANHSRYDAHPATVAFAETLLILFGFYTFPFPPATTPSSRKSWRSLLAASFRASVFGS